MATSADTPLKKRQSWLARHEIVPTENGVSAVMRQLLGQLRESGLPDTCCQSVEIAVAEALNNVVEHAFAVPKTDGKPEELTLECKLIDDQIRITIEDNGVPLPGGEMPEGRAANLDVSTEDLPEGGFGWFLIHTLTDAISYERIEDRNRVRLLFSFGPS